jgi:cellulose synthase/poly-beta-1,6-N-acetylglucosamine synthase-like glycosyltransferase
MAWVFAISLGWLLYAYGAYPLWRRLAARGRPAFTPAGAAPARVSVLIAAHDEAGEIAARVADALAQAGPFSLEVLVGSDGSRDATVARARGAGGARVFDFPRGGKMATLNRLAREATGDALVFTDANTRFAPGAVAAVVAPLADPSVGCVAGAKVIAGGHGATEGGEGLYWRMENALKSWESAAGSCPGADGALYAVRRAEYPYPEAGVLVMDDFLVSLSLVAAGRRCVFAPAARALEPSPTDARRELRRKARIFAGALNVVLLRARLLAPGSGVALALWSHKLLRWFGFVPLLGLAAGLWWLPPLLRAGAAAGLAGLLGAFAAGLASERLAARLAIIRVPYYFLLMNVGQAAGVVEWLVNGRKPTWEKLR